MAKRVRLSLTGRQRGEDGRDTITQIHTEAEFVEKDKGIFLFYSETTESAGGNAKCRLKLKSGLLELTKSGETNTRMVFETGKEYLTDYATPYGTLRLGILTHSMNITPGDCGIEIQVTYTLSWDARPFSECDMKITINFY